ncbi:hypothetical protein L1987_48598 [Smallanthus sonchifolius]|uniref:Uncharacterized protein n=1 Tax=Smallanthus sonchifolius TaxID=185202 RepID=A0ACB9FT96_9ASTR|nr:hypothetical protein L1987_48598 [Smallanthus sonchifolius]
MEASVADQEESATAVALMAIGEASCSSNEKDKRPPVQKKGISKRQPGRIPKASLNVPKSVGEQHFETPVVKLSKPQKRRLNKRLRKLEREFLEGKFDQKPVSGKLTGERPNFSKPDFTEYSHKTVVPEFSKHQSFQKKEVQNKKVWKRKDPISDSDSNSKLQSPQLDDGLDCELREGQPKRTIT